MTTSPGASSRPGRTETEVRRMLEVPHPAAPAHLAEQAMARGRRLLRRRRLAHITLWTLLAVLTIAGAVLAARYWPSSAEMGPPVPSP